MTRRDEKPALRRPTRREAMKLGVAGGALLTLGGGALLGARTSNTAGGDPLSPLPEPFEARLTVPPVLRPVRRTATTDHYRLVMRQGLAEIIPGLQTPIWGYDGVFPGPTIRARKGRPARVRHVNGLREGMVVHNHGAYVDGDSDGYPTDFIAPGRRKDYLYPNAQNARTLWYHDHAMSLTSPHVYKGLAGFYLITDKKERALPLPKGPYDVPLMICDRSFNADGSFDYPGGVLGNVMLVNGKPWPRFEVAARKYRLRFLNASNVQDYELALDSGQPFTLVASESGLLGKPVIVPTIPMGPGERFEAVVDFSAYPVGSRVVLKNRRSLQPSTNDVMRFDVVRRERDESRVPAALLRPEDQKDPTHLPADPDEVGTTRRWVFDQMHGHWTINGKTWDEARVDAVPSEGEAEIWEFVSNGGLHPAHLHLANFRIIERNGGPPRAHERGWKDTALVERNDTVKVLVRWPEVPISTKNPGPYARRYPFHCHQLEHGDHHMMLQFRVARRRKT